MPAQPPACAGPPLHACEPLPPSSSARTQMSTSFISKLDNAILALEKDNTPVSIGKIKDELLSSGEVKVH